MAGDERDLLQVLKFELSFLDKGGYHESTRERWRSPFFFEDSPTCMNYDSKENPAPCEQCILMGLVPDDDKGQKIPCRHIPLNASGETLDSLYRSASHEEIEEIMRGWLRTTIEKLESAPLQKGGAPREEASSAPAAGAPGLQPAEGFSEKLHPKCANPACPVAFHWLAGGKFFRFHIDGGVERPAAEGHPPENAHHVKHYWLCDRCAMIYSLVFDERQGVVVRPLWPELPYEDILKKMHAA